MITNDKEYLQQLHNSLGEAVFAVKLPERIIEYVNPAIKNIFGYSSKECIGKPTEMIYPSRQDYLKYGKLVRESIQQNKKIINLEFRLKRKNGEIFFGEITTSFIKKKDKFLSAVSIVKDITQRKQNEEELNRYRNHLEQLVSERTKELEQKTLKLEEINIALNVILEQHEKDKKEIKKDIYKNIEKLVFPYLDELKRITLDSKGNTYVDIIESNLKELIEHFSPGLSEQILKLTPAEIQIANLVKQGKTTKEIADLLNLSTRTINFHRESIRGKLGLKNQKVNLRTHLTALI